MVLTQAGELVPVSYRCTLSCTLTRNQTFYLYHHFIYLISIILTNWPIKAWNLEMAWETIKTETHFQNSLLQSKKKKKKCLQRQWWKLTTNATKQSNPCLPTPLSCRLGLIIQDVVKQLHCLKSDVNFSIKVFGGSTVEVAYCKMILAKILIRSESSKMGSKSESLHSQNVQYRW